MAITDWPEAERPRERLLRLGPRAVSDAELLAVLLRSGIAGRNALDLGRDLLCRFGNLAALFAAGVDRLGAVPGVGKVRALQLQAALELTRRALGEEIQAGLSLTSPGSVRDFLPLTLLRQDKEVFLAIFLDAQHRVLVTEELSQGTLTQTSVYPREVVRRVLHHNAAAVIFAHNHPSGVAEPSREDELLTRALREALALVDVKVLDHFIVGGAGAMSFAERGLL